MCADSDAAGAAPRVAQLVEALDIGGAEALAVRLANARAAAGEPSCLYVLTAPGALTPEIHPDVRVRYLGRWWPSPRRPLAAVRELRGSWRILGSWLAADGIRVLQTHVPAANYWGLFLAWGGRCRTIATIHSTRELAYGRDVHPLRRLMRRILYRRMLRSCAAVVAVSADVRTALLETLGVPERDAARLVVVPNGVDAPAPADPERRAGLRRRHGLGGPEPAILAAGRLDPLKNFDVLIEAVARLRDAGRRCRLLVAGDGPARADLERLVAARGLDGIVGLPGAVLPLDDLLPAGDVFVQPSDWEGLPLALLEAMGCGVPCVGSRVPGIRDVIDDGRHGLLVPPRDADALAAAIARLCDDEALARRLGEAGRERVRTEFSFAAMRERLEELYRRAARSGS